VVLPYAPTIAKVLITSSDLPIAQTEASASTPSVTVTYPNGGEHLSGVTPVTWTSSDLDGDTLYHRVFYSSDDGATWFPMTTDITETFFIADTADLHGTETGRFRVAVSDGFHNAEDQSNDSFAVNRKPPVLSISGGLDGASLPLNTSIVLDALAFDTEDGTVDGAQVSWVSDLDGPLGSGLQLYVSDLSAGVHRITAVATDTDAMTGTDSVYLEVLEDVDGDGQSDSWERNVGLDPTVDDSDQDPDGDGLPNVLEFQYSTDPFAFDTDYDGYDDLTEVLRGSDPLDGDSIPPVYGVYLPLVVKEHGG